MTKVINEYKKYRWFHTSSKKMVIGGKSANQNDDLLKTLKKDKKELIVMHTSSPGSPFSIILSPINSLKPSDIEQAAIFTGCFSKAWKDRKKRAEIHIFKLSQLSKPKTAKAGTWQVKGKIKKVRVELQLALTLQYDTLRAVPLSVSKSPLLTIVPGTINKEQMLPKIALELGEKYSQEAILSALPPGGVKIRR